MFNLFKKNRADIHSIHLPDYGWREEQKDDKIILRLNQEAAMAFSINFYDLEPDLPTIQDVDYLRNFYRQRVGNYNGGLVALDIVDLKQFKAVKTLFKFRLDPTGMMYVASYIIPFRDCSYVLKIEAPEVGTTGIREAVVTDQLLRDGKLTSKDDGMEGWFSDPYDPTIKDGLLMNIAEREEYDEPFPQHPLSLTRAFLQRLAADISFGKELDRIEPFRK